MDDTDSRRGKPSGSTPLSRHRVPRAANAAKHGLTATTLLPEILGPGVLERHRGQFLSEWAPQNPTELLLVEELARHAAALERATPIEEAVLRTAADGYKKLARRTDDGEASTDPVLAAACGTDSVDRLTRYRRAHEKGFLAALVRLRELRADGASDAPPAASVVGPLRFSEAACLKFLCGRFARRDFRCPSCASGQGQWLARRKLWQCQSCRRQLSPRSGTVMERSSIPLKSWFAVIAAILAERNVSTAVLCEIAGIDRKKTVRAMAERVHRALDATDTEHQLAGLNRAIVEQLALSVAEPGAPLETKTAKRD